MGGRKVSPSAKGRSYPNRLLMSSMRMMVMTVCAGGKGMKRSKTHQPGLWAMRVMMYRL